MKGILLYGHGARNPEWAQPFHRIREAIKARDPRTLVEPGFLELMRPTFDEGVNCLVEQGATKIIVVPIFMAAGSHVKKDLPRLAADAMDRHEGTGHRTRCARGRGRIGTGGDG
jgi:sirohydrochlorin cobaltochelatase